MPILKKITLPIDGTPTIYDIPENFGKSQEFENTDILFEGIDSNSFISIEINGETSTLLKYTGAKLIILSNSTPTDIELLISEGKLQASKLCSGKIFYAGSINANNQDLYADVISLNYIVQNGIATGNTKPNSAVPGQIYIQID